MTFNHRQHHVDHLHLDGTVGYPDSPFRGTFMIMCKTDLPAVECETIEISHICKWRKVSLIVKNITRHCEGMYLHCGM